MDDLEDQNEQDRLKSKVDDAQNNIAANSNNIKDIVDKIVPSHNDNKALIDEVIKYTEDNLKVSKYCRDNGLHALSIYHLEQAAELVTKTLFYMCGLEVPRTHNQIELISKFIDRFDKKVGNNIAAAFLGTINSILTQFKEESEKEGGLINLVRLNEKTLTDYLNSVEQLKSLLAAGGDGFNQVVNATLTHVDRNKRAQMLSRVDTKKDSILKFAAGMPTILLIGLITYPHEAFTRYHDEEISAKNYNEQKIDIVKLYDRIYSHLEEYINARKEVLS